MKYLIIVLVVMAAGCASPRLTPQQAYDQRFRFSSPEAQAEKMRILERSLYSDEEWKELQERRARGEE